MNTLKDKRWPWVRFRFRANPDDWRPVTFPPPGPYWCSGEAGDGSYAIVVAYLPNDGTKLREFWPEASHVTRGRTSRILFTDRFPRPSWWSEKP